MRQGSEGGSAEALLDSLQAALDQLEYLPCRVDNGP